MARGPGTCSRFRLVDLSLPVSSATAEPAPPIIDYVDHARAAQELAAMATSYIRDSTPSSNESPIISPSVLPDGLGLANENLQLDSHAGTHMDAPWHFGPFSQGRPAKTIDQVPLEWCFGPGVVLDLRNKQAGDTITVQDLLQALAPLGHRLSPGEIVLLMTGADKRFNEKDYYSAHPGMGREATFWLLDQGIRVIGTDGWGFDRPAGAMLRDYLRTGDTSFLLPGHFVGREREYCHIEKLANLDRLPPTGFWVSCFPVKIERGSAGWVRAVAMLEEEPCC